jgi:hypothetical protein
VFITLFFGLYLLSFFLLWTLIGLRITPYQVGDRISRDTVAR